MALPATFNFDWIRSFLTLRRVASLERWTDDNRYIRSVCIGGASTLLTIRYVREGELKRRSARSAGPSGRRGRLNDAPTTDIAIADGLADGRGAGRDTGVRIDQRGGSEPRGRAIREGPDGGPERPRTVAGDEPADAWLDVSFTAAPTLTRGAVRAAVTRMFDLDGDLETFIAHVRRDRLLGPLVKRRPHVRLPRLIDPFEGLVRAMLGQQVTVRAASTMTDRFTRQFGAVIGTDGADADVAEALYAFPRPDAIAALGADALRGIGLTRAKATAIARLAETLASGRLDCARLADLPSDDVQAALVALPGIGPWTASYVRMRVLGDRDAFPAADLGVIKALEALGIARADQVATAERWRPWRAYAVLHLWESLSD